MSETPTASPVVLGRWEKPSNLASIAALAAAGQVTILPHELIRTTDGRVYHWTGTALEITSAPVHHGTVADVAALAGVYLLPSCTRGVHSGDTAYVTAAACEYRVASGVNATATWAACATIPTTPAEVGADPSGTAATAVSTHNTAGDSHADIRTSVNAVESRTTSLEGDITTAQSDISTLQTDVSTLQTDVSAVEGDISTLQGNVATLTQGIQDAVSTHNTATDAHADIRTLVAGKQDSLTISDVGEAMLALATPSIAKIPRVDAVGTVTLIDVPIGSGGAVSTLDAEIIADTPTAYWRCSEVSGNLADSSGGAHTLTVSGTPVRSFSRLAHGLADEHIRWSSAYASRADTLGVAVPWTGSWSLEFVVLLPAGISVEQGVFAVGVPLSETEANNYQLYASLDTGQRPVLIWEYGAGTNVEFKPEPVITLGERHLIAWTKDAASKVVRCYIDGCCVFEASYTQEPTGGGSAVTYVGRNSVASTSTAVLGHIAFWSGTVLSQERIQAIEIVEKAATDPADMIDEIIKIARHVTDHYEHEIAALEGRIRALERAPIDKSPRETIRRIVREEVRSVLADTAQRMKDPEL